MASRGLDLWLDEHVWKRKQEIGVKGENLLLPDLWLDFLQLSPIFQRKLAAVIACVRRLRTQATVYPEEDMCMAWARGAGGLGGARVRGRENEGVGVRPEDCWVDGETLEDREA